MRRLSLLAFLLGAGAASASCAAILGYDSGTLAGDGGLDGVSPPVDGQPPLDSPGSPDGPRGDGTRPDAPFVDSPFPADGGLDSPMQGDVTPPMDVSPGMDSPPVDSPPPIDSPTDMDASITCPGCPGTWTTVTVYPPSAGVVKGLALDGNTLYWALSPGGAGSGGSIVRCNLPSCTPSTIETGVGQNVDQPVSVTLDSTNVYWSNVGARSGVFYTSKATPGTTTQAQNAGQVQGLSIVGSLSELYLGFSNGVVESCPIVPGGCSAETTVPPNASTYAIAAGATYTYWGYDMTFASAPTQNIYATTQAGAGSTVPFHTDPEPIIGMTTNGGTLVWLTQSGSLRHCVPNGTTGCTAAPFTLTSDLLPSPFGIATNGTTIYVSVVSATGSGILAIPYQ